MIKVLLGGSSSVLSMLLCASSLICSAGSRITTRYFASNGWKAISLISSRICSILMVVFSGCTSLTSGCLLESVRQFGHEPQAAWPLRERQLM